MKILIVDDEPINRTLLHHLSAPYGESSLAGDVIQAVEAFAQGLESGEPFHLVLLDVVMPCMDGVLALKKMRVLEKRHNITLPRAATIIMTTSMDSATTQIEATRGRGCDEYLIKPITKKKFLAALKAQNLIEEKK